MIYSFWKNVASLILILCSSFMISGQCSLGPLSITENSCNDSLMHISIDFSASMPNTMHFELLTNETSLGYYKYENLPVSTWISNFDCEQAIQFTVRDSLEMDCSSQNSLLPSCCSDSCQVSNLTISTGNCSGSRYTAMIDFEHNGTEQSYFNIHINDQLYTRIQGSQLPYTIDEVPHGFDIYDKFQICSDEFPNCCTELLVLSPCECAIYDISTELIPCNADGKFGVILDFKYQNTSANGFIVGGNGNNYGSFQYDDLPVKVNNLQGDSITDFEFLIVDMGNAFCFDFVNIGTVHCGSSDSCTIGSLTAIHDDCMDQGSAFVSIDFLYNETGAQGFNLYHNQTNLGQYQYSALPLRLGPFPADCQSFDIFRVRDIENNLCENELTLSDPLCCLFPCTIDSVSIGAIQCTSTQFVNFELNMNVISPVSDSFQVILDSGILLTNFAYSDLPVLVKNYPISDLEFENIRVCDQVDSTCCAYVQFGPLNCQSQFDCHIDSLQVNLGNCVSKDSILVSIDFEHSNTSASNFLLFIAESFIDSFKYIELPINNLQVPIADTGYIQLKVVDGLDETCSTTFLEEPPNCQDLFLCTLGSLILDSIQCTTSELLDVRFNFQVSNPMSSHFYTFVDQVFIDSFAYVDLPDISLQVEKSESETAILKICDALQADCCSQIEIIMPSCEASPICQLDSLQIKAGDCSSGNFQVELNWLGSNIPEGRIQLSNMDSIISFYPYNDLPATTGPFQGRDSIIWKFIVQDLSIDNCVVEFELGTIHCETTSTNNLHNIGDAKVYYQASKHQIIIDLEKLNNQADQISVYDTQGFLVYNKNLLNSDQQIYVNATGFLQGIYFVRILIGGRPMIHQVFVPSR